MTKNKSYKINDYLKRFRKFDPSIGEAFEDYIIRIGEASSMEELEELKKQATAKVSAARIYLVRPPHSRAGIGKPYLTPAVMRLKLIPEYEYHLLTAAVDSSWRMYYFPLFIMKASIELIAAVVEHEVWHLLKEHHRRSVKAKLPDYLGNVWNLAADAELHNDADLYERHLSHGFKGVNSRSIGCKGGQTLEQYYNHLMERVIVYETDSNYEVFINSRMPDSVRKQYEDMGSSVEISYKGPRAKKYLES